jgi:cytochrome c oxidase assembly factor CtaG
MLTAGHMVEHGLLAMVTAPLIVLAWVLVRGPVRTPGHPLGAWSTFVAVQWAFHLTPLLSDTRGEPVLHTAEHAAYIAAAVWFWLPVLGGGLDGRSAGGLGDPARSLYLFGAAPAIDLVGAALMIRGDEGAGVAMLAGSLPIVVVAGALTWRWLVREEEGEEGPRAAVG